MPNTQTIAASTSEPQAFPTITFGFKKPGLREPLPASSSLDNGFKVANGSTASGFVEPPISHTMKFEAGPIYLQPGVKFTRFVNTAFNTASGAAYQLQHSPPSSPGWGSSRYADHGTPAANSMMGHYSMHNHLAQAERTPSWYPPFQSNPIVSGPVGGKSYAQESVYSEDMEFSSPPPEGEQNSLCGFPSIPGQPMSTSGRTEAPVVGHHYADTGSTSQHMSFMIGEDSDAMKLLAPGESLANFVATSYHAGHNIPAPASATTAGHYSVQHHWSQTQSLPPRHRRFQSNPNIPSPVEGEHHLLNKVHSEDTRFLPPPPPQEGERPPLNFLPLPPKNPMPTCAADAQAPVDERSTDTGPASQHKSVMIGEDSDAMQLVDPGESLENPEVKTDELLRDYVPSPIPEELNALADSYQFGRPLTILISNGLLEKHWSLKLPREYGYAMLGYFKILGIQVCR
jgi:hypothetical protein